MNKTVSAAIKSLLEDDQEEDYLERRVPVRPETAARLNSQCGTMEGSVILGIGSTQYNRDETGHWLRIERKKNPAYWDKPQYFIIYPGPDPYAFIVVKQPRKILVSLYRKAIMQIYKDATGHSWYADQPGVDGSEAKIFNRRVSKEKPEPAYEIFLDGTWKRLS